MGSPRLRSRGWGRVTPAAGLCILSWLASSPARADIHYFVDGSGVMHFTNTPDKGQPWKLYARSNDGPTPHPPLTGPRAFGGGGLERYGRYDDVIREAATYYQLPEAFVRAIIKVESDYDPAALSIAGAQGLMQLMPETASRMLIGDAWDPRENVFGGCRYLRVLANAFNGDLDLTIAAYNAGEGAVIRAGGIPDISETQDYVVKVKGWYRRYRATRDPVEASIGPSP